MIAKVNYLKRLIAFEGLSLKDFASEIEVNSNFLIPLLMVKERHPQKQLIK